jgi:Ca2+-binding EF-hand superfamily protein
MAPSAYKTINGVKYERHLYELAESFASAGPVKFEQAKLLWLDACDGPGVTNPERESLQYCIKSLKTSPEAAEYLKHKLASVTGVTQYQVIKQVKYERDLLQAAEGAIADGPISEDTAKTIKILAYDGKGITETEERTLQYILDNYKLTDGGKKVLEDLLATLKAEKTEAPKDPEPPKPPEQTEAEPSKASEIPKKLASRNLEKEEQKIIELEEHFGKIFDDMDRNGDGNLSHNEVKKYVGEKDAAIRLRLGIGKWQEFLSAVDADGDGKVDRLEFVVYFSRLVGVMDQDPEELYGALFDSIDVSSDGSLQYGEIRDYQWYKNPKIFEILGVGNFSEMVKKMDKDGSGTVERDEFISFMQGQGKDLTWQSALATSKKGTKRKAED